MGTDGPRFAEIRQASRSGNLQGTEVFSAGIGMGEKNGVPPATMGFTTVLRPATPDEARKYVAQQAPLKPDFIKIWVDDFWGQYPKLPPQIYKAYWKEHFDLLEYLKRNWSTLGPKLVDKLRIYIGTMDTYQLDIAVREMQDWMKSTENPHYEGFFEYGVGEPHCYTGRATRPERLVEIAEFISSKRPYIEAVPWWKY